MIAAFSNKGLAVTPDNEERRIAIFRDNKLRLLMTLAGFERLGIDDEPDTTWIIPSTLSAKELHETHEIIEKHRNNPIMEYGDEDPLTAEEMLRRAPTVKPPRADYDDDSQDDGIVSDEEDDFLFRAGGPTEINKKPAALQELKKKRRKRRQIASGDEGEGISDEMREARRNAKMLADREKRRKMKSQLLVRDSDDESNEELDREFFAREEALRMGQGEKVLEALRAGRVGIMVEGAKKRKSAGGDRGLGKRARIGLATSVTDNNVESEGSNDSSSPLLRPPDSISSDEESVNTSLSSPRILPSREKEPEDSLADGAESSSQERVRSKASALTLRDWRDDENEAGHKEEEDAPRASAGGRRRARAVVADDSDDE